MSVKQLALLLPVISTIWFTHPYEWAHTGPNLAIFIGERQRKKCF